MLMSKVECTSCRHMIDAAARLCPYCDADPQTGRKLDLNPLLQEGSQTRERASAGRSALDYLRARQGVVVAGVVVGVFLMLYGLHQFVTYRNETAVSSVPAVPLTEVADLSNQSEQVRDLPMPPLELQYDARPKTMRTFVLEPGAVAPRQPAASQGQPPGPAAPPRPR
jgi:hypothetical protein